MNRAAEKDIRAFYNENPLFKNETIVLEKNENSSLIRKVKPCNAEFFERLFNHLFWEIYSEYGFAAFPFKCKYLSFIGKEMFFCKNTAERFLKNIGLEKGYSYSDGRIKEFTPISIANIIFVLAMPFELARNAERVSIAALKANAETQAFEQHYRDSINFWKNNKTVKDPLAVSAQAINGALLSMRFSIVSSLASSLKIKLRESFPTKNNFLKQLIELANSGSKEKLRIEHGYFSLSPYDISKPFLEEDNSVIELLARIPVPKNPYFIWRQNSKLCCSMHLAVLRKCFQSVGEQTGLKENVFFLKPPELELALSDPEKASNILPHRKKEFEESTAFILPPRIAVKKEAFYFEEERVSGTISGFSVGSKGSAVGRLVFVEGASDFGKVSDSDILFSKSLSPELVVFYKKCSAVISETGGMLSHSAVVARERGIPCIVQVEGSSQLKEGKKVRVDGDTGKITIL